jgi:acylphosphatase
LGLTGYVRNLDDGRVEVYAVGGEGELGRLAALLQRGPRGAMVYGVEEQVAEDGAYSSFAIEG